MKKSKSKMPPARSWIEASFQKRECCTFISSPKDDYVCQCGRIVRQHVGNIVDSRDASEEWITSQHTKLLPTDAYGTIEFQGGPHPSKAQYIRIADDTKPELLLQLFSREWNMELPKLLITVHGGRANFELQPKLKKVLRKGLFKAAKTTGAWIFIGGTNTGVTRPVGDALISERSQRNGRVVSLGFAPWGIVEKNNELIGIGKDVPYHSISSPRSTYSALDNRLAYFLLVDDGTHGKYGCELVLRRELELFLSKQRLYPHTHSSVPVVCLIIEGGTNAIRVALEYVTDDPPVPVVVFDGSGRAADLLAFVHKYASEFKDPITLSETKEYLLNTIQQSLEVTPEHAECLYEELLQCAAHRNLITIFRVSDRVDTKSQELDQIILTALFKAQHLTPTEQLSLALTWNRVDIARSEIFIYGQEWPKGALEEAMMHALEHDRLDFVKLLMENGVSMRKFLSIPRLEELYNTKQGPSTTLGYILRDIRPHIPIGYSYTLHDIGLVINKLMGGAYKAFYTKRRFRPIYAKVMSKASQIHRNSTAFVKHYGNAMSLLTESLPAVQLSSFDCPFNELLIWAVLMKRQKMAILMFQHGEEALAKALVACKLYKAMAHEAAEDDMETEVYEELRNYGKEFEQIALELLDFCYREDDDTAQQLLTCELQNWSGQTCLSLAVSANHRALLAHPCSQVILADLWMGGLRTRKNTNLKIILGLFFPLYILQLEFKSREELQLMPQTVEEHLELENDYNDKSDSKSNLDAEALLFDNFIQRDTIVQENGKVMANMDEVKYNFPLEDRHYPERRSRPLKVKKRVYEFFTAPITKFWANSIAYLVFLIIFSYTVLVKMELMPSWQEFFAISYIIALGCEKIRELICSEPAGISQKFVVWIWNMWNVCDALAVLFFLVGLIFRIQENTMEIGRVMYCVNSIYWYLRILNILGVNKYLGPLVTMMGKMVKNMIYFVVLLLVVLMSFGVCRQAILFPNKEPNWHIAKDVFFEPYFMLYGEVFADGIDPSCGDSPDKPCLTGRWVTPAVMAVYLLIANILLINLLIAVFNNIFNEVNSVSHQVWMFQRYTVVMEYEQKPIFPPPLILLCHVYLVLKYIKRKLGGITETYDNGLKLFLEKEDMERLYDFEEDCVEGYFAEQELKLQQSSDERIKFTAERVESIYQKVEDINTKENAQSHSMQGFDIRLRKIEGTAQDILERINSIRRCMASQANEEIQQIVPAQIDRRSRKISERSSIEVTPDWVALCGGKLSSHVEENDESPTQIANPMSGSEKQLNILGEEEQRPRESISSASTDSDVLFAESYLEQRESVGRRSLESGNVFVAEEAMHGSKRSLNCRQLSQTHSEPDNSEAGLATRMSTMERNVTFGEPQIKVIQPPSSSAKSRNILLAMHAEYTSITDELESMCELLSAPKTSSLLSPPCPLQSAPNHVPRRRCTSELSNPEQALFIEKERLRDAEESDYYLMKRLIKRKHDEEREAEENRLKNPLLLSVCQESKEHQGHILRRERAIDDDVSIPTHEAIGFSEHSAKRQDSTDSTTTNDMIPLIDQKLVQRPSIVMDSSQLPIQKEIVEKAESNTSLRMQSETMC